MKYKGSHFLQLSRGIFKNENFQNLSTNSKWVYVCLNELEHRFTGKKEDFFFHRDKDIAEFSGVSVSTVKRSKAQLTKFGMIQTWQMHWIDKVTQRKSEKHVTAYRIN